MFISATMWKVDNWPDLRFCKALHNYLFNVDKAAFRAVFRIVPSTCRRYSNNSAKNFHLKMWHSVLVRLLFESFLSFISEEVVYEDKMSLKFILLLVFCIGVSVDRSLKKNNFRFFCRLYLLWKQKPRRRLMVRCRSVEIKIKFVTLDIFFHRTLYR